MFLSRMIILYIFGAELYVSASISACSLFQPLLLNCKAMNSKREDIVFGVITERMFFMRMS